MSIDRIKLIVISDRVMCNASDLGAEFALKEHWSSIKEFTDRLQQGEDTLSYSELCNLGDHLFESLFNNSIRQHFMALYSKVASDSLLRLELVFADPGNRDAALPWEFLRIPDTLAQEYQIKAEPFLAVSEKVTLVRKVLNASKREIVRPAKGEKLRAGVAISKPKIWGELRDLGGIDDQPVLQALDTLSQQGKAIFPIDYKKQDPAAISTIRSFLETYKPHIFHYIGHGDVLETLGAVLLLIDDQTTDWEEYYAAKPVEAKQICGLFETHCPSVIVLQACNTAKGTNSAAYTSMAAYLAEAGIPLVVAMQYEIQNQSATQFAQHLYEQLANGVTLEEAVNSARRSLYDTHNRNRAFGTPVIYVNTDASQLFPRTAAEEILYYAKDELTSILEIIDVKKVALPVFETCFYDKDIIRFLEQPSLPAKPRISELIDHLVDATSINGPKPLAYFVATLADRIKPTKLELANKLQEWLKKFAAELGVNPKTLASLVRSDLLKKEPPRLQLRIELAYGQVNNNDGKEVYLVEGRDQRKDKNLIGPGNSEVAFTKDHLPEIIRHYVALIRKGLSSDELVRFEELLWIEFWLEHDLSLDVDQWRVDNKSSRALGEVFNVVVCSLERWKSWPDEWPKKWAACKKALEGKMSVEGLVLTSENELQNLDAEILGLTFNPTQESHLAELLNSGSPVIIWTRLDTVNEAAEQWLRTKIHLEDALDLHHLVDFVREERKSQSELGKSLVLLWDDFDRRLPDVDFFQIPT